jgi:hypothetical protein
VSQHGIIDIKVRKKTGLFRTYHMYDKTEAGHSVNLGVDEVEKSLQESNTVRYYIIQDSGGVGGGRGGDVEQPCGITFIK